MNMMTAIIAPPPLLERIERALRRHDLHPATFGRRATKDPQLVFDLRRGRNPRPATEAKVRRFIETLDEAEFAPPRREFATAPLPPIAILRALPAGGLTKEYRRLRRLAKMFAAFDRDDMEAGVELLLAEMDARDGDPDDDTGGTEDEPLTGPVMGLGGPGCQISDTDFGTEDSIAVGSGDRTYAEWHTLPPASRRAGRIDGVQLPTSALHAHEDDEEDDAPEAIGDEHDTGNAEDEHTAGLGSWLDVQGPGCVLADPAA